MNGDQGRAYAARRKNKAVRTRMGAGIWLPANDAGRAGGLLHLQILRGQWHQSVHGSASVQR